jgi:hypothetical protein
MPSTENVMTSDEIKKRMLQFAEEVNRLHSRVHETFAHRSESKKKWQEWKQACSECHAPSGKLGWPVPYGPEEWLRAISIGETEAVEAAVCFLECRPYFFRSGYMFKDILRKCKRAPMSEEHASRFKAVLEKWAAYRARRRSTT